MAALSSPPAALHHEARRGARRQSAWRGVPRVRRRRRTGSADWPAGNVALPAYMKSMFNLTLPERLDDMDGPQALSRALKKVRARKKFDQVLNG